MKLKHFIFILLFPLFATQCKKEEPMDLPCLNYFKCDIDGIPFITKGNLACTPHNLWYDRVSGNLSISGRDCSTDNILNKPRLVGFYTFGVFKTGEYTSPKWSPYTVLLDNFGQQVHYDSVITGSFKLTTFILDNYSKDWQNGVMAGTFEFTLWNTDLNDTVKITNGDFCMRMY